MESTSTVNPRYSGISTYQQEQIAQATADIQAIQEQIRKAILGHDETINLMLASILCNGHVLLEGMPGVAKTTLIKTVTTVLGLDFKRVQFTPDLLPADLIGTLVYNQKTGDFEARKGPIFTHIVLADEINRAPAKVQSALLEAMQEHQVTIGNTTYHLEHPFLVFATQNPIEQEGTYPLPEAQVDRFMCKLVMGYPSRDQEKRLLSNSYRQQQSFEPISRDRLDQLQNVADSVYIDELVVDYITRIVATTREPGKYGCGEVTRFILHGASPRATLALQSASRAYALIKGRHFVIPDDVKAVCPGILRHRLILTFEAEAEGQSSDLLIAKILAKVAVP
ncbi:MAG: MoxR family ATPase [Candidatus Dependentiae bacterium]|nr:MoxR family ATPase [Candidatus Dependentiae bacterium]